MKIRLYDNGQWSEVEDPSGEGADVEAEIRGAGYDFAALFGGTDDTGCGVAIDVWRHPSTVKPEFLLSVEVGSVSELIGVGSTVDLMDLMARWVPVAVAGERRSAS